MIETVIEILEKAKNDIVANIQSAGITASGRTERSFRVEQYNGGVMLVAGGEDTAPIGTLEIGRAGGNVPQNFTDIILGWMHEKGITEDPIPYKREPSEKWQPVYTPEERGEYKKAYFIAKKIKEKGTERNENQRNDIYSSVIPDVLEDIKKVVFDYAVNAIKIN